MHPTRLLLLAMTTSLTAGVPNWELLPRREKMGQIMYTFVHLVDQSCTTYHIIPDCRHVLALHGLTNLINLEDELVDRLDPSKLGSHHLIWDHLMSGVGDLSLPYYQDNKITINSINNFPQNTAHNNPSSYLHPYAPISNTRNTPTEAVSDPHPYAVKVTPPPEFLSQQTNSITQEPEPKTRENQGYVEQSPEDRFANWVDSDDMVGQGDVEGFETWSKGDVIVGNQAPVEDIYVSWSDADEVMTKHQVPEDRFASWTNTGMLEDSNTGAQDHIVDWNGVAMDTQQTDEDTYTSWNDYGLTDTNRQTETDRYDNWNVVGLTNQENGDVYSTWNQFGQKDSNRQPETDRYDNWNEVGATNQDSGDIYSNWNEYEQTTGQRQPENDRYADWNEERTKNQETEDIYTSWSQFDSLKTDRGTETDTEMINRETSQDINTNWSKYYQTNSKKSTERDIINSRSDSGVESNRAGESALPLGIQATADFEPAMVETRVVVSRVAPPTSWHQHQDRDHTTTTTTRRVDSPPVLPLLLLRK